MQTLHTFAAVLTIASIGVTGAAAQGKGNTSAPKGPKSPTTTVSHGNAGGAGKSADTGHGNAQPTTVTATTTTTTTTTAATTPVAPPNALSMKISKNPQQLARLSAVLPQGMTLEQATTGFRNQGQFIAALNASKNQGVSFADLQTAMTVDGLSLGQAVRQLRQAPGGPATSGTTGGTTTGGATTTGS